MSTYTICRLVQGATTVDLNDVANRGLNNGFAPMPGTLNASISKSALADGGEVAMATRDLIHYQIPISEKGANHDALWTLVNAAEKLLKNARSNQWVKQNGWSYTPVYFEFASTAATNVTQREVVFGDWVPPRDAFGKLLAANRLEGSTLDFWCRPFADKTSLVSALTVTATNNGLGNAVTIPALAGVEDAPCRIIIDTINAGADDILLVAVRALGTPANFTAQYEMESATLTVPSGWTVTTVNSATETAFSPGSSNVGIKIVPNDTDEELVATLEKTSNLTDQFGAFKPLMRAKAITNTNVGLRARPFLRSGALDKQYGPYLTANPQFMKAAGEIEMLDLAPLSPMFWPPVPTNGNAVKGLGIDFYADASSVSGSPELRLDYLSLVPLADMERSSALYAQFPVDLRATGVNKVILDSRERQVLAGLFDSTATPILMYPTMTKIGRGIYLPTGGCKLYFMLLEGTNWVHDYTRTFNVTVDYLPRYPSVVGTT